MQALKIVAGLVALGILAWMVVSLVMVKSIMPGGAGRRFLGGPRSSSSNCHVLERHSDKCPPPYDTSNVCQHPDPTTDPVGNIECWMRAIPNLDGERLTPFLAMLPYDDGSQPPSGKLWSPGYTTFNNSYVFLAGPGNVTNTGMCQSFWGRSADYWSALGECRMKSSDGLAEEGLSGLLRRILGSPVYRNVDGIAWLSYEDTTSTMDCAFRCKQDFPNGYFTFNQLRRALGMPMALRPLG